MASVTNMETNIIKVLMTLEGNVNDLLENLENEYKSDNSFNLETYYIKLKSYLNLYKKYNEIYIESERVTEEHINGNINFIVDMEIKLKELNQEFKNIEDNQSIDKIPTNYNFNNNLNIKLPEFKLRTFNGNILKFKEFWDNFSTIIDNNQSLNKTTKLTYLKSSLMRQPYKLISHLKTEENNYQKAVTILFEKYDNKNMLISRCYDNLRNIKQSDTSIKSIRITYEKIKILFKEIDCMDEKLSDLYKINTLFSKFPDWFNIKLRESNYNEVYNYDNFCETIEKLLNVRETLNNYKKNEIVSNKIKYENVHNVKFGIKCACCNGKHYSENCEKYTTVISRMEKLGDKCKTCLGKHESKTCKRIKNCVHCQKSNHHRSLCYSRLVKTEGNRKYIKNNTLPQLHTFTNNNLFSLPILMCKLININNNQNTLNATVLLDTGSSETFITQRLSNLLNLEIKDKVYKNISSFGNKNFQMLTGKVEIGMQKNNGEIYKVLANVVPVITKSINYKMPQDYIKLINKNIKMVEIPQDKTNIEIDLLIGTDNFWNIIKSKPLTLDNTCYIDTIFGALITSSKESEEVNVLYVNTDKKANIGHTKKIDNLEEKISNLWELDYIGLKDSPLSNDNQIAVDYFNKTIKFKNNRYYVSLPFFQDKYLIPNNFNSCFSQLINLYKRLKGNNLLMEYNELIKKQLNDGIIERINQNPISKINCHYVPHYLVISKNTNLRKLRIVYNGSYKTSPQYNSLNDCLLQGPIQLNDLVGVLIKSRFYKYLIICDMEKAFWQLRLDKKNRDYIRFLWFDSDNNGMPDNNNIVVYRFKRVPFGIKSAPFLLINTIKFHLENIKSKYSIKILQSVYMDNFIISCENENECIEIYKKVN